MLVSSEYCREEKDFFHLSLLNCIFLEVQEKYKSKGPAEIESSPGRHTCTLKSHTVESEE